MFQHWIPKAYLESWTDPDCPAGQTPFVWLFDLATFTAKARGPKNILGQKHYYTLPGAKDPLYLEKALQKIESAFIPILRKKIETRATLTSLEKVRVLAFAAAMKARTKVQLDHLSTQFNRLLTIGRDLETKLDAMTPEKRRAYKPPSTIVPKSGMPLNLKQVQRMVDWPAHAFVKPLVITLLREFGRMSLAIVYTEDPVGFITSDAPCVLVDPQNTMSPALNSRQLQVQLPLSPRCCLLLTRDFTLHDRYIDIDDDDGGLAAINRFTCDHAGTSLVSRSPTIRSEWFRE